MFSDLAVMLFNELEAGVLEYEAMLRDCEAFLQEAAATKKRIELLKELTTEWQKA